MHPTLGDPEQLRNGVDHVRRSDPRLRRLVDAHGMLSFRPHGRVFQSLVYSILSQQLNGKVADLIISRVNVLFHPGRLSAEGLYHMAPDKLRRAGVSPQKIGYLKDLSAQVVDGRIDLAHLTAKSDEMIVRELNKVRGVGPWTAHMVLMFSLGRPDVLPVDDLGIKKAVADVYGLAGLPNRATIEEIARPWHPYSTIACLYLWKYKDPKR